jgi:uncharacterized membrane protein
VIRFASRRQALDNLKSARLWALTLYAVFVAWLAGGVVTAIVMATARTANRHLHGWTQDVEALWTEMVLIFIVALHNALVGVAATLPLTLLGAMAARTRLAVAVASYAAVGLAIGVAVSVQGHALFPQGRCDLTWAAAATLFAATYGGVLWWLLLRHEPVATRRRWRDQFRRLAG